MWLKPGLILIVAFTINPILSRDVDLIDPDFDDFADAVNKMTKTMDAMKKIIGALGRQTLLQQFSNEERVRSEGDSGVKQIRFGSDGTRNYYTNTHTGGSVLAIHDHTNNIRTVGMGEFIGVLNGVEFRTRHNDYRLYMPHRTSKDWHAKEEIPFPDVPPEVLNKPTVDEQAQEMRMWFKAWKDQNSTVRDYRKYFKPILCYLEGAWTTSTEGKIEEPFESDRHFVDASSWFDLQEKVRFTSYTGRKDNLENFAFLPTTIMNITEEGYPQFAQWNYRIMCHPLSRDLPLNRLRVVDELGRRMATQRTYQEQKMTRAARFQLNPFDTDEWKEGLNRQNWGLLDELMAEIPGKDNYAGNLTDEAFDLAALSNDPKLKGAKLRADRYHRWYEVARKGAMGLSVRHRGFADENLFMAMTTQSEVAGMDFKKCRGRGKWRKCDVVNQRFSYAIPLEIIYMTPLYKWNPYDIEYKGVDKSVLGKTVEEGGRRNGKLDVKNAYNGTNSRKYYHTPVEFFSGVEVGSGAADTTRDAVGVLDKKGNLRKCKASGTRIFFPLIPGIGILRQRYPIMPVHGEGSSVWKELEATKDLLLKSKTNGYLFHEPLHNGPIPTEPPKKNIRLQMQYARTKANPPGPHEHEIVLTADQVEFLKNAGRLTVRSSEFSGHFHDVKIFWWRNKFYIANCDSKDTSWLKCWDKHPKNLVKMPDE